MPKYAKLNENGLLEYAPVNYEGISNWIYDMNAVLAAGYLPVEDFEVPQGKFVAKYAIINNRIVPIYEDTPPPTYVEKRIAAYPSITDQLDMIYWDKIKGTTVWVDTISEIKTTYPKPEVLND